MGWDWAIDTGKGLVAIFIVWLANLLRKQLKPFIVWAKRLADLVKTINEIKATQAIEKNKLLAMVNITPNPYYIINASGEMVYANQAWLDLTGFRDEKEALGLGYLRAVHPEDRKEIADQRLMIAKTESSYNGAVRFKNLKTGKDITLTCVSQTFTDQHDKIAGTIGTLYITSHVEGNNI